MNALLLVTIALMIIAVLALMVVQHNRATVQLVSVRNVFVFGFIFFQLYSAARYIYEPAIYYRWVIDDVAYAGAAFVGCSVIFLSVLLVTYHRGWLVRRLAARVPAPVASPAEGTMLGMAIIFTLLGMALWLLRNTPLAAQVAIPVGTGFAAIACGLVAWVWVQRPANLLLAGFATATFIINALLPMTTYGRRSLVSLGAVIIWAMYYRRWNRLRAGRLVYRFALIAIGPIILIAMFSNIRGKRLTTVPEVVTALVSSDIATGVAKLSGPQDAGHASMWIIAHYHDQNEPDHLFTLRAYFHYFVPRAIWPDKPPSLGQRLPDLAGMKRVGGLNVGPGIVGSAMAEGGLYALVLYGFVFGLVLRLLDEIVVTHHANIFIVLPIGSALGEFFAMPRGETYWMADLATMTMAGTGVTMLVLGKYMEQFIPNVPICRSAADSASPP